MPILNFEGFTFEEIAQLDILLSRAMGVPYDSATASTPFDYYTAQQKAELEENDDKSCEAIKPVDDE